MRKIILSVTAIFLAAGSSPSLADEITSNLQFPIDHNRSCRPDETPCLPWASD